MTPAPLISLVMGDTGLAKCALTTNRYKCDEFDEKPHPFDDGRAMGAVTSLQPLNSHQIFRPSLFFRLGLVDVVPCADPITPCFPLVYGLGKGGLGQRTVTQQSNRLLRDRDNVDAYPQESLA